MKFASDAHLEQRMRLLNKFYLASRRVMEAINYPGKLGQAPPIVPL